ncbi:hypothetical protein GCM10020331_095410 [Ectobacillus funiculus]
MVTEGMNLSVVRARVQGYRQALEEAGLEYDENLVLLNNSTFDAGKHATQELLDVSEPPTAIFLHQLSFFGNWSSQKCAGTGATCS